MNRILEIILKGLRRKVCPLFISQPQLPDLEFINDRSQASSLILKALLSESPCMIARYGAFELATTVNYLGLLNEYHSIIKYIRGEVDEWWWNASLVESMRNNAGFFPNDDCHLRRYCQLLIEDSSQVDILGSWQKNEHKLVPYMSDCDRVRLRYLEPDFATNDASSEWTQALKGKRVLVIHPFTETIKKQYAKRNLLFKDPNLLPEFDLLTIKAVQSLGGNCEFSSWFEALDYMKAEMDKLDYDMAILGCGAYGFNLAAHAKRTGHKAIHLGGATQLLFGIMGKRWEDKEYYKDIINEHWCRPDGSERPNTASSVEGGCYW